MHVCIGKDVKSDDLKYLLMRLVNDDGLLKILNPPFITSPRSKWYTYVFFVID